MRCVDFTHVASMGPRLAATVRVHWNVIWVAHRSSMKGLVVDAHIDQEHNSRTACHPEHASIVNGPNHSESRLRGMSTRQRHCFSSRNRWCCCISEASDGFRKNDFPTIHFTGGVRHPEPCLSCLELICVAWARHSKAKH